MEKLDNEKLLRLAKEGDDEAFSALIDGNMGLVKKIAYRFRGRGCEFEDLVQIGTIGMIKAVNDFDFSFNTAFSTYAVPLIIGEIRRFLRDDGLIKVSRNIKKNGIMILKKKEEFEKLHDREPKISELCALCDLPHEDVIEALDAITPVKSLQDPINDDGSSTLDQMLCDPFNEIDTLTEKLALKEELDSLPEEQKKLIILRYYKNLSQQKTGEILGMTQVKVSREEKKIIEKLRKAL